MVPGENGPDTGPAVVTAERTQVYPLWELEKDIPAMKYPNAAGQRVNMMYPIDFTFWEKLKAFVDYEPLVAISAESRGVLASIGIVKGSRFEPTKRQRELLVKAVEMAPKMILASRMKERPDGRNFYYNDRNYISGWNGATAEWMQKDYLDIDGRAIYFQQAYSSAPAMVMRTIGEGSKYPVAIQDADGDFLTGSNHYKMHLPAGIPAKAFWAVTLYNISDGTMPETDQLIPSRNGYENVDKNPDGSIDLYFGPTKPGNVGEMNWIQTIEGRNFMAIMRLYGADIPFFDQTWKPDNIVKIQK